MDPVEDVGTHRRLSSANQHLSRTNYRLRRIDDDLDGVNMRLDTLSNSLIGAEPSRATYVFTPTVGDPVSVQVVHQVSTGDIVIGLPLLLLFAWQLIRSIFNATRGTAL